jgi:hypothetical protein
LARPVVPEVKKIQASSSKPRGTGAIGSVSGSAASSGVPITMTIVCAGPAAASPSASSGVAKQARARLLSRSAAASRACSLELIGTATAPACQIENRISRYAGQLAAYSATASPAPTPCRSRRPAARPATARARPAHERTGWSPRRTAGRSASRRDGPSSIPARLARLMRPPSMGAPARPWHAPPGAHKRRGSARGGSHNIDIAS